MPLLPKNTKATEYAKRSAIKRIERQKKRKQRDSTLVGNKVQCLHCSKLTECNKENMIFSTGDEEFVGKDV